MIKIENDLTRLMMQFCYNCDDAKHCATEEMCKACLTDKLEKYEDEQNLTLKGNQYAF